MVFHRPPSPCHRGRVGPRREKGLAILSSPGHFSTWGLDKAPSSLCAAQPCRLVQAEVVRDEVEEKLLLHAERVRSLETDELIAHYRRLVELADPDAAGIRRFLADAMGRLTREGPGRRRGQEKQDAGLRLPAQA